MYQTFRPDGDIFLALLQKKKCRKPALNAGLWHFLFFVKSPKKRYLGKKICANYTKTDFGKKIKWYRYLKNMLTMKNFTVKMVYVR